MLYAFTDIVLPTIEKVFDGSWYLPLFAAAFLFLAFRGRENAAVRFLCLTSGILTVLFFLLPLSSFVLSYTDRGEVYWRMLWIVPIPVILAAACTAAVCDRKSRTASFAVAAVLICLFFFGGTFLYTHGAFKKAENPEKVGSDVLAVSEIIDAQAKEEGTDYKKLAADNAIVNFMRSYDASIQLAYGRQIGDNRSERGTALGTMLSGNASDTSGLGKLVEEACCNFVAAPASVDIGQEMQDAGYRLIGQTARRKIYYSAAATKAYAANGNKVNLIDAKLETSTACRYTGSPVTPSVRLTYQGMTLTEGTDYRVSCTNNTAKGKASVLCSGTGRYCGSISADFIISDIRGTLVLAEGKSYTIRSDRDRGNAIDVEGASFVPGTRLWLYGTNGSAAQDFILELSSSGKYLIRASSGNLVLDAADTGKGDVRAVLAKENGSDTQEWKAVKTGDDTFSLQNGNGLYLDVADTAAYRRSYLVLRDYQGTATQKFIFVAKE